MNSKIADFKIQWRPNPYFDKFSVKVAEFVNPPPRRSHTRPPESWGGGRWGGVHSITLRRRRRRRPAPVELSATGCLAYSGKPRVTPASIRILLPATHTQSQKFVCALCFRFHAFPWRFGLHYGRRIGFRWANHLPRKRGSWNWLLCHLWPIDFMCYSFA
jgi:hypothetical protein